MNRFPYLAAALFLFVSLPCCHVTAVSINTVPVGNPGNAPDSTGFGAVPYAYRIGETEVTNSQYAEFLNAVAASDPHDLYDPAMGVGFRTGISQSGSDGSFTYAARDNFGNKPVNYVSFWDTARFANWLHNGQPVGPQGLGTTEDGAYFLNGVTNPVNSTIFRSPNARWFLPTIDEWYKAAYHQPVSQCGDIDDYWLYPTATNTVPTIATANSVGDIGNPGMNIVNYEAGADWNGQNGNLTTIRSAGPLSTSFYGTFNQAGNLSEWNETIFNTPTFGDPILRGVRGGALNSVALNLASKTNTVGGLPFRASVVIGFRVASIPEPSAVFLSVVGLLGVAVQRHWRS